MGLQCHKRLWLNSHQSDRPEPGPLQQHHFDEGTAVGELARERFPGGTLIEEDYTQIEQAIVSTVAAIAAGATTLYEAAFRHKGVLIRADILTRTSLRAKRWSLFEVKKSGSGRPIHLHDLAIQKWVLEGAGIPVAGAALVHVNTQYVREGALDLEQLFTVKPLDTEIREFEDDAGPNVLEFLSILRKQSAPQVSIGPHCNSPYECEYKSECWTDVPEHPIFELTRIGARAWDYWNAGTRSIEEIPPGDKLSPTQRVQVDLVHEGGVRFERKPVAKFLSNFEYPIYFLDFESVNPAIPPHDGLKPYQQMPFQFSIHRLDRPGAEPVHKEFLPDDASDPRVALATALLQGLGEQGSIAAYSSAFEKSICRQLGEFQPGHRAQLDAIVDRMRDLALPFQKRWVATPEMRGSYSLKYVTPALLGSESSYTTLDIQAGMEASTGFARMIAPGTPPNEKQALREALLIYCGADTLNTARIYEWLRARCDAT